MSASLPEGSCWFIELLRGPRIVLGGMIVRSLSVVPRCGQVVSSAYRADDSDRSATLALVDAVPVLVSCVAVTSCMLQKTKYERSAKYVHLKARSEAWTPRGLICPGAPFPALLGLRL